MQPSPKNEIETLVQDMLQAGIIQPTLVTPARSFWLGRRMASGNFV